MNRNANSHFAYSPSVNIGRSKWNMSHNHMTSFNIGDCIPIECMEILPGDTVKMKTNILTRMQTLLAPIFGDIYVDTYYFFVPDRLIWTHFKEFMGENTTSAWYDSEHEYTIPQITAPVGGWETGTLADYFGYPIGKEITKSALPFRAYALIMNEWFRSEVVTDPLNIPMGDSTQSGSNGSSYINDVANGGKPFKACRFFDAFSGCTPTPQKGPDVTINLGNLSGAVYGTGKGLALTDGSTLGGLFRDSSTQFSPTNDVNVGVNVGVTPLTSGTNMTSYKVVGLATKDQIEALSGSDPTWTGLAADVQGTSLITINQLREAFQIQKFYEKGALYGTRYREILASQFGVTSPDARMQIPEYLGGHRFRININSVTQTSATEKSSGSAKTPQGNQTAYSVTGDSHNDFIYSSTEHGMIIGLMVPRYVSSYQQGCPKFYSKKTLFDFYFPVFANLGAQGVRNDELYCQDDDVLNPSTGKAYNEEIFGYQEAWYDYRYRNNLITGELRSDYDTSLDVWHLADDYDSLPTLGDAWMRMDKSNLDRCLAVSSSVSNQMFADIFFDCEVTRAMPLYSLPGLIDHN